MTEKEAAIVFCLGALAEKKLSPREFVKIAATLDSAGEFRGSPVADLLDSTESLADLLA